MFALHILKDGFSDSVPLAKGNCWRIGRNPPCEILVSDKRISGEHAEIVIDGDRYFLRRTKGRTGIKIHEKVVDAAELISGTSFEIGDTHFTIVDSQDGMNLLDPHSVLSRDWSGLSLIVPPSQQEEPKIQTAETVGKEDETRELPLLTNSSASFPSRLLAQLVYLLRHASDRETLAKLTLDLACQRMNAGRAVLARVQDSNNLRVIDSKGIAQEDAIGALISKSVLKQIVDERRAVVIGNVNREQAEISRQRSVVRNNIKAVACTPIFNCHGELTALLYVDNQNRSTEFSMQDAELLILLGQTYALLDENLEMSRRLEQEVAVLKRTAVKEAQLVAESPSMIQLLERVKKVAASEASVLILGESGSGKECIARLLHTLSQRSSKAIVARNCAAIPDNLFDSEMFGHKKGSFTGAEGDRKGAFLEADGGTLFLDEIGDLDFTLQNKLLRAIQEKKVLPVGSDKELCVNVRLISATNRDLREACKDKSFREDLFFRISTVILEVPPLRNRKEDTQALARAFVSTLSNGTRTLSAAAEAKLLAYQWPGNVRELLSVLEQAVIFCASNEITPDDLNLSMNSGERIQLNADALDEVERRHCLQVLQRVNGNKTEAAKVLGLARSTLVLKLKAWAQESEHADVKHKELQVS